MWERACSRKRRASHYMCQLTERFREQARSHNLIFIVSRALGLPPALNQPQPIQLTIRRGQRPMADAVRTRRHRAGEQRNNRAAIVPAQGLHFVVHLLAQWRRSEEHTSE